MTATLPTRPDLTAGAAVPNPRSRSRLGGGLRKLERLLPPSSPQAGPASHRRGAVVSSALLMVAVVCIWVALQLLLLGRLSHDRAQELLYGEFRTELASATAPVGPTVEVGRPVALLTAPSIGLEQVVVEGTASGDTLAGPGHRRDTPLPGQVGTSVVYGRATTYGGPFRNIAALRPGDPIEVAMAQGKVRFSVLDVRRAGDPLPQPAEPGTARLTLVTAEGSGPGAGIAPRDAVYVDAQAKKGFPSPPGRPGFLPEPEKAMAGDPGAMPLLALCLALLVATALGVVAARQRWSTALVWVIASPLVIALSWITTDVVMRLLPNLM